MWIFDRGESAQVPLSEPRVKKGRPVLEIWFDKRRTPLNGDNSCLINCFLQEYSRRLFKDMFQVVENIIRECLLG